MARELTLTELRERFALCTRPRWDAERPIYYVSPYPPRDGGPWKMVRWFPEISSICDPLMGHSMRDKATGKIMGVRYPRMEQKYQLYREGLELIAIRRSRADVLTLAVYRRQVALHHLEIDRLFIALARSMEPELTEEDWHNLAVRMPHGSYAHAACLREACGSLKAAAE